MGEFLRMFEKVSGLVRCWDWRPEGNFCPPSVGAATLHTHLPLCFCLVLAPAPMLLAPRPLHTFCAAWPFCP